MGNKIFLSTLLVSGLFASSLFAQSDNKDCSTKCLARHPSIRKFYVSGALDGAIFSTATIHHDGTVYDPATGANVPNTNTLGTTRFTYFVNLGATFNFNFSPHVGLYTGVDIKNVGYIEQNNGWTTKRRTYNVGAPLGIKIGNMGDKGTYFLCGGGLDVPINFQEKYFKTDNRSDKQRINEWLSDRTPSFMPYVFAGFCFNHHITAKVQYYTNNFLNVDYVGDNGIKPYMGTEVHLVLFSVSFSMMHMDMHHNKKKNCHSAPPKM